MLGTAQDLALSAIAYTDDMIEYAEVNNFVEVARCKDETMQQIEFIWKLYEIANYIGSKDAEYIGDIYNDTNNYYADECRCNCL